MHRVATLHRVAILHQGGHTAQGGHIAPGLPLQRWALIGAMVRRKRSMGSLRRHTRQGGGRRPCRRRRPLRGYMTGCPRACRRNCRPRQAGLWRRGETLRGATKKLRPVLHHARAPVLPALAMSTPTNALTVPVLAVLLSSSRTTARTRFHCLALMATRLSRSRLLQHLHLLLRCL